MATLPTSGIELERRAAAPRQAAKLAQQFVARHDASVAADAIYVKAGLYSVAERLG